MYAENEIIGMTIVMQPMKANRVPMAILVICSDGNCNDHNNDKDD